MSAQAVFPASRWVVIPTHDLLVIPDAPQARSGIACRRGRTWSSAILALRFASAGMTMDGCGAAGTTSLVEAAP